VFAARGQAHFIDLRVYRMGGAAVLHGRDLYTLRYDGLPFTYPPFAAVIFAVLATIPWNVAAVLLTAASVVALPVTLYLALRLSWPSRPDATRVRVPVSLAAGAAAIWLEPARTTLSYGQVDLLLAAAVLYDLTLPDTARRKGVAIGLAAGLKLTPAIFVVYLVITHRLRAAATAAVTFAATVALGFVVLPGSSAWYWTGTFARPSHVSPIEDAENQSLLGALARMLHTDDVMALWLLLAIAVAVTGLASAAAASRRGDEALGFSLCAVTGLLVSPISWTHHWVIAIPALLLAGVAAWRGYQTGNPAVAIVGAAGIAVIAIIGWTRVARDVPGSGWLDLPAPALADSTAYVVLGLLVLALATYRLLRPGPPAPSRAEQAEHSPLTPPSTTDHSGPRGERSELRGRPAAGVPEGPPGRVSP
jgi:alpha-1,2-mannosyltransferase